jgi:ketosteroid isomerase-like protein
VSAFREAVENKDFDALEATLASDVVFRSPVVFAPYEGREAVAGLLRVVGQVLTPNLSYVWQVREGDREVLCFNSVVDGREIDGVDLLHYNEDGLVAELTVMVRPLSALVTLRDAIGALLTS